MSLLDVYKALADESRLRLVAVLRHGYFNVQELTSVLGLSQATVSHHLKVLQGAGLTKTHREGTWTYHALTNGESNGVNAVVRQLLETVQSTKDDPLVPRFEVDDRAVERILGQRRFESHRFFETVAGEWHKLRDEAVGGELDVHELLDFIPDGARLADLGCGTGIVLEQLLPRSGPTIGIDYSQGMLQEAGRMLGRFSPPVDLRLGSIEHLPLGDGSIDVALACMVLHHIAHPPEALRDAFRVLAPGGKLLIVDLLQHNREYMRERYADLWMGFNPAELQNWLTEAGFTIEGTSTVNRAETAFRIVGVKPGFS